MPTQTSKSVPQSCCAALEELLGTIESQRPPFSHFDIVLPIDRSIHAADSVFAIAQIFQPEASLESFAWPPALDFASVKFERSLRDALPQGAKVLAVHLDTLAGKTWPPDIVSMVLKAFLLLRREFFALVVGTTFTELGLESVEDRVLECRNLSLADSFAIVAGAEVFFGVDSCMLHMADLSRVSGVALFAGTNPNEFGFRFSRGTHIRRANRPDMLQSVEHAVAALNSHADVASTLEF